MPVSVETTVDLGTSMLIFDREDHLYAPNCQGAEDGAIQTGVLLLSASESEAFMREIVT